MALRLVELFSGIGAQRCALRNLGIPCESAAVSEIDANAVKAYEAIHGPTENLGDVRSIERLPACDLLTYSFPCQDLSVAGTRTGMAEGSGTRSSLLWEVGRLLDASAANGNLPQTLLMENVPAIHNRTNMPAFQAWISKLKAMGYASSWADLRATDYGVPQNRVRTFMVSRLNGSLFRFPAGDPSKCPPLRSVLEPDVPDSYDVKTPVKRLYLSEPVVEGEPRRVAEVDAKNWKMHRRVFDVDCAAPSVTHNEPARILDLGELPVPRPNDAARLRLAAELDFPYEMTARVYDPAYASLTVSAAAGTGGGNAPKILAVGVPMMDRGRGDSMPAMDGDGIVTSAFRRTSYSPVSPQTAPTLNASEGCDVSTVRILPDGWRIRHLTERECWRLMGQSDADFDRVKAAGVKKTQLYRLAGNSIVVPVLEAVFKALYIDRNPAQSTLEGYL